MPQKNKLLAAIAFVALAAAVAHIALQPDRGLGQLTLWTVWLFSVIFGMVLSSDMTIPALDNFRIHFKTILKAVIFLYFLAILANGIFTSRGAPLYDSPSPLGPILDFLGRHSTAFWRSVGLAVPAYFLIKAVMGKEEHS